MFPVRELAAFVGLSALGPEWKERPAGMTA
jgi:hypothetical protein